MTSTHCTMVETFVLKRLLKSTIYLKVPSSIPNHCRLFSIVTQSISIYKLNHIHINYHTQQRLTASIGMLSEWVGPTWCSLMYTLTGVFWNRRTAVCMQLWMSTTAIQATIPVVSTSYSQHTLHHSSFDGLVWTHTHTNTHT